MFEAPAGFDPQLRFAVPSGHFFDIDDISISNLPHGKTAPAGRNEVFGIKPGELPEQQHQSENVPQRGDHEFHKNGDRKSTRLNSSHVSISYAVFCLKKKKNE